jgi:NAD(P)-dependent dehydrogenase (short-subunit alcohol dehydrogenase family)
MCAGRSTSYVGPMSADATTSVIEPRVAVVTGGASGIGAAITARLLSDGFRVAVLDMAGSTVAHPGLTMHVTDVTNPDEVKSAFAAIYQGLGRIDVLVNNAGITGSSEATVCHLTPLADFDRVMAVNVRGPWLCSAAVLPSMLEQGSGHIINIASVAGFSAFPARSAYTASKGAAVAFTRSLAIDYGPHGIRSNAICPGMVETPMTQWRLDQPDLRAKMVSKIPLGRVAQPADIGDVVASLASDGMRYVNGHCLVVDGGWTA